MSVVPYKVVLLGDSGVGKTALARRFLTGNFSGRESKTRPAIPNGNLAMEKRVVVGDQTVVLSIWDTAGEERFRALQPMYYNNAPAALLVYDVTDSDSFARVKTWVKELTSQDHNVFICIAGNKCDLMTRKGCVDPDEAKAYAESVGAKHFNTSAKLGQEVASAFVHLATLLAKDERCNGAGNTTPRNKHMARFDSYNTRAAPARPSTAPSKSSRRRIHIEDEDTSLVPRSNPPTTCCCIVS